MQGMNRERYCWPAARVPLLLATLAMALLLVGCSPWGPSEAPVMQAGRENPGRESQPARQTEVEVQVVAGGLDTPWALAFAPDGRIFFTERPGQVRVVENGSLADEPLIRLPAAETAEGGVMGLAVDPNFPDDPYLYTMYTYRSEQGLLNRIVRLRVEGSSAREDEVLLDGIPGGNTHNGGRVKIGPDGLLYATTGDAGNADLAQDPESLAGKILRLELDGSIPDDNPIQDSPVYTLGHRNSQGLDWQPGTGRLYATEHGAAGNDEVNLIDAGENYGWPVVEGEQHGRFNAPVAVYSPAIAPAGAAFYNGDAVPEWQGVFFFATLRGNHLHRIRFDPQDPRRVLERDRLYEGEFGRLRDVVMGPDGALYVTTSNRDGRGSPEQNDDRILRIGPAENRALLYPDLRTLPPEDLSFAQTSFEERTPHLLRFSITIWNAGQGPLELRAVSETVTEVFQRIYDDRGVHTQRTAGSFEFHQGHSHWHFEDFALYELWEEAGYDAWLASGRTEGEPGWQSSKISFCIMDIERVEDLPGSPPSRVYSAQCGDEIQGISVGWGDVYHYYLDGQGIDLGEDPLPDGRYVLRAIADPLNLIHESEDGADPERESREANEGTVRFSVADGQIAVE